MLNSTLIIQYIKEFKVRLIHSLIFFILCFGFCYYYVEDIYSFLAKPLTKNNHLKFIYTSVAEGFFTYIHLAFISAFAFSMPFFLLQFYLFISPALYKKEKLAIILLFIAFCFMFCIGFLFLYYGILPNAFEFLVKYQDTKKISLQFLAKISDYIDTITTLILAFGFVFQLPIILIMLIRSSILTTHSLKTARRFVVVVIFTISAIITPPDVMSQIILAITMMAFYELTILIGTFIEKNKLSKNKNE